MFKEIFRSFIPWILYPIFLNWTQKINLAIVIAIVTSIIFGFKEIKKGFILSWGTLIFFIFMFIVVNLFEIQWINEYAWVFSNGSLALITWISILVGKPFTMQYAKEAVSREKWQHPVFIKINYILTSAWGCVFLSNLILEIFKIYYPEFNNWFYEIVSYIPSIFGIGFTAWFPDFYKEKYIKEKRYVNNKNNPYLSGNYAPVVDELEVKNLKVIGEIPKDLIGIYMRNGPNPMFSPISYTYPYDGDGMIHAIYIADGKADYRNRYVETKGLTKERKAGKALYGGLLKPIPIDPQWADPEDEPIAIKNGVFIHVIRHGENYLALSEAASAYKMTAELKTIGEWNPCNTERAIDVCAHNRLDPLTGDLWFINYGVTPPYLTLYCFDRKGAAIQKWDIEKSHCSMIHDFILTKNYVIIFDCPAIIDINQVMSGGPILNWRSELGVRVGLISRSNGKVQWFDTEAFFVFHFANAYEEENEIIIDYIRHDKLVMRTTENDKDVIPHVLYRSIINLNKGTIKHIAQDDRVVEFPRIREDCDTLKHQFIYTPTKISNSENKNTFNALIKYDVNNQKSQIHDFGHSIEIGEAVFAPSATKKFEDDGYLMLFTYNSATNKSEFVILDANNFTDAPLARIQMPRRIPHGLHGSWMSGEWI